MKSELVFFAFFIRGGDTFDTEVPLGTYSIKYAAGRTWYGPQCLFGVETIFKKADYTFEFQQQGNEISGYRIEQQFHAARPSPTDAPAAPRTTARLANVPP